MFDEATRPAIQENLRGFGDAFAGRGSSINTALGVLPALLRDIQPVARSLVGPRHPAQALLQRARRRRRASSRPPPRRRPSCSGTSTSRSPRSTRVARPFIQDSITEGPADARRGDPLVPASSARSCATASSSSTSCSPGRRRWRPPRPTSRTRSSSARTRCAHARRSTAASPRCCEEVQRSPTTRSRRAASSDLAETLEVLNPTLQYLAPAQLQCNYITLWFRNVSSLLSEGDVHGTWQRFIIIATPQGPNNEGVPRRRPPTAARRRATTTCTPTGTRTRRRPASRRSARPATSRSSPGAR